MANKSVYGDFPENGTYEKQEQNAREMNNLMKDKEALGWSEIGIALYISPNQQYMVDCNTLTTTVYRRDNAGEEFYTGSDGWYVLISDTSGLNEWLAEEGDAA